MAKRARGTVRPGQRRPTQRPAARPAATVGTSSIRPSDGLTPDMEARAAELEEQIRTEERAAEKAERQTRDRSRHADPGFTRREAVPLAIKAADEYAYVRRDIFRISRIGAIMLLVLAVLHVLINVAGVISV
jgi:hypothetical protein